MPSERLLQLKFKYKNGPDNIGRDLVSPCLSECSLYRRGSGFFSSDALAAYVEALDSLIQGKTKVQILCSPCISDSAARKALEENSTPEKRQQILRQASERLVLLAMGFESNPKNWEYRQKLLSYLLATETIEIKFAIPRQLLDGKPTDQPGDSLYHVKTGYFKFPNGDCVAFSGSFNESGAGHGRHTDDANVFRSWVESDTERLKDTISDIDADWDGKNEYILTFPLSEKALKFARENSRNGRPSKVNADEVSAGKTTGGGSLKLRPYQLEALRRWAGANYQGVLAMATGTGKTKTAIQALIAFREKVPSGFVIITAPYQNLADQWVDEIARLGIETISVFDNVANWSGAVTRLFQEAVTASTTAASSTQPSPVMVSVNKTFNGNNFQGLLRILQNNTDGNHLLIVDECHHYNDSRRINLLPIDFKFRLGLSATPYEPDERRYLEKYFGSIVYDFPISRAIAEGILCAYTYHPVFVELSEEEASEYVALAEELSKNHLDAQNQENELSDRAKANLGRQREILDSAIGKIKALRDIVREIGITPLSLFYCGQGRLQFDDGTSPRYLNSVANVLHGEGWTVGKITWEESLAQRKIILNDFSHKKLEGLVSIRVLDEGIDIPDCRAAFILASQSSQRQGIQRRGRILRKAEGKDLARLFDFIFTGPMWTEKGLQELFQKEKNRATLFASDAMNKDDAEQLISMAFNL